MITLEQIIREGTTDILNALLSQRLQMIDGDGKLLFDGFLNTEQKDTLRLWCRLTRQEKIDRVGDDSFSRFVVTLITDKDPGDSIKSCSFKFISNDNEVCFDTRSVDSEFEHELPEADTTQFRTDSDAGKEVARVILDFYKRNGHVVCDTLREIFNRALKNAEFYNKVCTAASGLDADKGETLEDRAFYVLENPGKYSEELEKYIEKNINTHNNERTDTPE